MNMLHNGRRRTKMDRSYSGPPRQGPVRHISAAQLNLERVLEQDSLNLQKMDSTRISEPAPGAAAKGKPRLLLMGQRRYVLLPKVLKACTDRIRSGKSSISSVVFHKMPPNETLFLESTARIHKDSMQ